MIRYLIDTHIFLWWLADDPQLPIQFRALIESPKNQIFVSAATLWEIVIKKSIKKLSVDANLQEELEKNNFFELPITATHALAIEQLPLHHKDPFDRILVAQALFEDMILLTVDPQVKQYTARSL